MKCRKSKYNTKADIMARIQLARRMLETGDCYMEVVEHLNKLRDMVDKEVVDSHKEKKKCCQCCKRAGY